MGVKLWTSSWQRSIGRVERTELTKRGRAAMEVSESMLTRLAEIDEAFLSGTDWDNELQERFGHVIGAWAGYADALPDRLSRVGAA